jgi:CDP-paratose 2-epimerase
LRRLPYVEGAPRFEPDLKTPKVGLSEEGLSETFPLDGARSLYGATKLASELLVQEYVAAYDIKAVVLRLGVIAGPWQMGRVDQGVVTLWVARHVYGKPLSYVGFGGEGRQVRDVLHVDDFVDLAILVSDRIEELSGRVFNAGGGRFSNVSLRELTALCRDAVGREVPIGSIPETSRNDVPWYVTDATKLREATGFAPKRDVATVVEDVLRWIVSRRVELESVLE